MRLMRQALIPLCAFAVCIAVMMPEGSSGQAEKKKDNQPAKSQLIDQNKKPATSVEKGSVMGHLQFRDKVVTIIRGSKGPEYTIKTKDGRTLAESIGEKDLKAKYPAIFNQVKHGLAGNDATIYRTPSINR
jgi:hypothetical protein